MGRYTQVHGPTAAEKSRFRRGKETIQGSQTTRLRFKNGRKFSSAFTTNYNT